MAGALAVGGCLEQPGLRPHPRLTPGLFFDSPGAARRGGCPDDVTPFNGERRAGIKALSSVNFPDERGPLREVTAANQELVRS